MNDGDWNFIIEKIKAGRCVPFLGAGASLGFDGPGLPTGGEMAIALAKKCGYPGPDNRDLFRVAQFFEMVKDRDSLQKAISLLLHVPGAKPSIVHRTLARLPISYVLTTNFDNLMERAFEENDETKNPSTEIYRLRGDRQEVKVATVNEPLVYKLHGSMSSLPSHKLIVTEDDVVEFLCCLLLGDPPLPSVVKSLFEDNSILFIGYGLKDWSIRVLLRAIRGGRGGQSPWIRSWSVQRRPVDPALTKEWEETVAYFDRKESLKCFDIDATEFANELLERYFSAPNA
jgi:hypothetical protein